MITIHDLETILEKPQPKEGGAIGPVSTLRQMRKKFSLSSFNRLRTITTTQKNTVSPLLALLPFFEQSIKAAVCLLYFQNFNFCCNP